MNARARIPMSFEEYLRWESGQREKHEYVCGRPVLRRLRSMAGGTIRHAQIAMDIVGALRPRLRGGRCMPLGSDIKVRSPTGNARYPDVTVECGEPKPDDLIADKPTVVVEVLSSSNDEKEIRARREDYQAIPSVEHIALVDYRRPYAELWSRSGSEWRLAVVEGTEGALDLTSLDLVIPLPEIYEDVVLD